MITGQWSRVNSLI